jgi:hypothetical protein
MFLHQVASTLVIATIMAGCASAPTDIGPETSNDHSTLASHAGDDAIGNDDYLGGAAPHEVVKCKSVKLAGSRLPKTICGPIKDDRTLFGLIDAGGYEESH